MKLPTLVATTAIVFAIQSMAFGQETNPALRARPEHMRAVIPLLEVQQLGGEFERWGHEVTVNTPKAEVFRWRIGSQIAGAMWKVLDGPPGSGAVVLGSGSAGAVPAAGGVTAFNIDFRSLLAGTPPAGTAYWVVLETRVRAGQAASQSNPVQVSYAAPNAPTEFTRRGLDEPITGMLESVRQMYDLPALGAAIVTPTGIQVIGVVGVRQSGHLDSVTEGDAWHLGSDTKTMTATLAAILVDQGLLTWETTLGEVFPDLSEMGFRRWLQRDYLDLTILDLLHHRTGQRGNYEQQDLELLTMEGASNEARRYYYTQWRVIVPPVLPIEYAYSNHNYVMAGAMLERVAGRSWEQLMRDELFHPLGMETAGFGPPGDRSGFNFLGGLEPPDQPRGHRGYGTGRRPWFWDNPPASGPAGNVHASLRDWAKFIRLHLNGSEGSLQLSPSSLAMLHTPPVTNGYAGGWLVNGSELSHNGSNTFWFARAVVYLEHGFGVLVVTNVGDPTGSGPAQNAVNQMANMLRDYYLN